MEAARVTQSMLKTRGLTLYIHAAMASVEKLAI